MKFGIGILTYNAITSLRFELLVQTQETMAAAFPGCKPLLVCNGSTDGTADYVAANGGFVSFNLDGNNTPGRGENVLITNLLVDDPDIVVVSDDDMKWKPGAIDQLERFWSAAPDDVMIVSGLLEPEWHWNTPREVVEAGGVRVLIRDSAPNAAWTFRARDWGKIGPLKEEFGQDYEACQRLLKAGYRVGQLDLADHVGWAVSTHENKAIEAARPLDRARWGI